MTTLDHIVLAVVDVENVVAWYRDALGLGVDNLEEWRQGAAPFPSIRINADSIIDVIARKGDKGHGLNHFCLAVSPDQLAAFTDALDVLEGPVPRSGARGIGSSIYVHDPDGTLVELRAY